MKRLRYSLLRNRLLLAVLIGLLIQADLLAQTTYAVRDTAYIRAVEQALVFLKKGDCQPCLNQYRKALAISQKSAMSTMRAALCAFQCNQHELVQRYVQQAVAIDYDIAEDVWTDRHSFSEFDVVRSTPMNDYVARAFSHQDSLLHINLALKKELQAIYNSDQQPRMQIDSLSKLYGQGSPQMGQHWAIIRVIDSVNLVKIERILQQYGYPGKSLAGPKQGNTAWLVIQHSPLAIQEKYLPMMQRAVAEGELAKSSLALLIDRIRMYKGQKQLYGSQVMTGPDGKNTFHPIEDEAHVNQRRQKMELGPIEDYARQFGFEYKPKNR